MTEQATIDADLAGPVSPPRDNGSLVFAAPWERRVFGIVMALCRSGACEWEDFRRHLIAQIADDPDRPYWESWSAALEAVLAAGSALLPAAVDERVHVLLDRPHGHDHRHDEDAAGGHGHGHGHGH